jgi:alpha-tubulin suppressor-like RCC1 family protein
VTCWGNNSFGELGDGTDTPTTSPVAVLDIAGSGTLSGVASLAPGYHSYCAILTSTQLACWGFNNQGQLANSTGGPDICQQLGCSKRPVLAQGLYGNGILTGVLSLASTGDGGTTGSYCAVRAADVSCWGWNISTTGSHFVPVAVSGSYSGVRRLIGNGRINFGGLYGSYCAILSSGAVDCWRHGVFGELGDGLSTTSGIVTLDSRWNADVPVAVSGVGGAGRLTGVKDITPGEYSYCATLASGGVDCWGLNAYGNLGNGSFTGPDSCQQTDSCSRVPRAVLGVGGIGTLATATSVASNGFSYCAVQTNTGVVCWGGNESYSLGNGTTDDSAVPVPVAAAP